jgi:stage III sporulation protein AG
LNFDASIFKYIKNMKGKWAVALLALVGVFLLTLGGTLGGEGKEISSPEKYCQSSDEYKKELEGSISLICSRVSGDTSPVVTVTLECGEEYVYAKRSDGSYVTSSGEAVLLCTRAPRVSGVAIVCRGGENTQIKSTLTELVCALLGIGSNRVFIGEKNIF